jgi:hypothetical protein
MAIILSLVEKTPWTVAGLLVAMAALLVYPVLHFAVRAITRVILFACVAILIAAFAWSVRPKNKALGDQSISVPAQITTTPPANTPIPAVKTPKQKPQPPSVKIEQHGGGSGAVGGNITTGPCSSVQVGGNSNQASVNCVPPSRLLDTEPAEKFKAAVVGTRGTIYIFPDGTDQDVLPLAKQICEFFKEARPHGANCVGVPGYQESITIKLPSHLVGIHCYSVDAATQKAFEDSGLQCINENGRLGEGGMTVAPAIAVGNTKK